MLRRKLFNSVLALTVVTVATDTAEACEACFSKATGPWVDASQSGALLLIGVTVGLQACFIAFFLYLRFRIKRARRAHSRPHLVHSQELS